MSVGLATHTSATSSRGAISWSSRPYYARVSEDLARVFEQSTRKGSYGLTTAEKWWSTREPFLSNAGYSLRPRYHNDWSPSWLGTNLHPEFCEDSIMNDHYNVMDAVRKSDSTTVSIKLTIRGTNEVTIARYLSSSEVPKTPQNHCVPFIEVLPDPFESNTELLVMPYLRPFDDPPFTAIGEVVEFIRQTLEGFTRAYLFYTGMELHIAANIMMDGRPLFPQGHHPVRRESSPDGVYDLVPLTRIDHPVQYYFIDFGISSLFPPGTPPYVVGRKGRDKEVPELSDDVPYNAYKVDIFILGNLYKTDFVDKFEGFEVLEPLIDGMTRRVPEERLTADEALKFFERIQAALDVTKMRRRLQSRTESRSERVLYDAVAYAREGVHQIRRLVS